MDLPVRKTVLGIKRSVLEQIRLRKHIVHLRELEHLLIEAGVAGVLDPLALPEIGINIVRSNRASL